MEHDTTLKHVPAWRAGAGGGAVASIGQFIGTTFNDCITHFFAADYHLAMIQVGTFLIGGSIMALAGAVIAYFMQAKTQNRWALFLAGAAFTSMGTTALPGINKLIKRVEIAPISVAYAAEQNQCDDIPSSLVISLKQFFGLDENGYRVVVGSFKNSKDAQNFADKLNTEDSSLKAFVGDRAPCNEFYPVIVGPSATTLDQARNIQAKVLKLQSVPGAFISRRTN